ncbi:MAG: 1-deoxy-D-xylulose-5-phosphate reductoisomerase [Bacteroidota bacterium]
MRQNKKILTILGSTGSIGKQTLDVVSSLNGMFEIGYLTVNKNIEELEKQTKIFNPKGVVIKEEEYYRDFLKTTSFKGEILFGEDAVIQAAADSENDIVLSSLVGFSGVLPTLKAIEKGIDIALANKETLVAAGEIITREAKKSGSKIIAVDSEHSAVLQSLVGENNKSIEKIILTASGGPFLNKNTSEFDAITAREALQHPNWSMGNKITIDSATMMNKGFEVIEAYWLFGVEINQIDVVIHPQSIIHSMVQFVDGSIKAQLGLPDMRIPISYALTYPNRLKYDFPRLDLAQIGSLTFFKPDVEKFPCLDLAYKALEIGGTAPAVLNAANEIAVEAFLNDRIKFTEIHKVIQFALGEIEIKQNPTIDEIVNIDKLTRKLTSNFITNL